MAAPNLKSPSSIIGKTVSLELTTASVTSVLSNASSSGKVLKINSIFAANVDGSNQAEVSISIYNGTTDFYIARLVIVPPKATQIISTKESYFYLEEGISIRAISSLANGLDIVVGYEEIS